MLIALGDWEFFIMLFYRIAHKTTARGVYHHISYCFEQDIYTPLSFKHWMDDMSMNHSSCSNARRTPCLGEDILIETKECGTDRKSIYGFESIQALKSWFSPDEIETLTEVGFHVIVLDVQKYRRYRKQMITPLDHFLECEVSDIINLNKI